MFSIHWWWPGVDQTGAKSTRLAANRATIFPRRTFPRPRAARRMTPTDRQTVSCRLLLLVSFCLLFFSSCCFWFVVCCCPRRRLRPHSKTENFCADGLGWGVGGGVGIMQHIVCAHMCDATQHQVPCTSTHGRRYATSCSLHLHTWSVLRN